MKKARILKVVAAGLAIFGIVLGLLDLKYAPSTLLLEGSADRPPWLDWVAWVVASTGTIAYLLVDYWSSRRARQGQSDSATRNAGAAYLLVGLAFAGVLICAFYLLLRWVFSMIGSLDPSVAAGILAASTTVLVSVLSVLIAKRMERKALVLKEIREKKVPVYEDLIAFGELKVCGTFFGSDRDRPADGDSQLYW